MLTGSIRRVWPINAVIRLDYKDRLCTRQLVFEVIASTNQKFIHHLRLRNNNHEFIVTPFVTFEKKIKQSLVDYVNFLLFLEPTLLPGPVFFCLPLLCVAFHDCVLILILGVFFGLTARVPSIIFLLFLSELSSRMLVFMHLVTRIFLFPSLLS